MHQPHIRASLISFNFKLQIRIYFACLFGTISFAFTVTAGEVTATMDTTTELSGTDEEDKREQNDYF